MISCNKFKWGLKVISVAVSIIFFFHQVSWASGITDPVAANTDPSSTMSPSDLESSQAAAESLVDTQNAIEQFSIASPPDPLYSPHGMEYDVVSRSANDWVSYYFGGVLKEKTFRDGRSYVYREYYASGEAKITEYYEPGGGFLWRATDHYTEEGVFSGKTLEYSNGRVYEKNKSLQDVKVTYANGDYVEYLRFPGGEILTETFYESSGSVNYLKEYQYDEAGRQSGMVQSLSSGEGYHYDGEGDLIKYVLEDGSYYTYGDYASTGRPLVVEHYSSGGDFKWKKTSLYDESGGFLGATTEYASGISWETDANYLANKIIYTDGSYMVYDRFSDGRDEDITYYNSDASVIYKHLFSYDELGLRTGSVKIYSGGREYYYDAVGRIERILDGIYAEERRYIASCGEVLYTTAVKGGKVQNVWEGLHAGEDLACDIPGALSDSITVTYDSGIDVTYSGGEVRGLSASDGFVNFYSEDSIDYQHSSRGDLYDFEDSFLRQVATIRGNIYNFTSIADTAGVTVLLSSAVVGGVKCEFSDSNLSALYIDGLRVEVIDLIIKNGLTVDSIKIERGEGVEEVTEGDSLFDRICEIILAINGDIPNIKFSYSPEHLIETILTSEYSKISFEDGLISKTVSAEGAEVVYDYIKEGEEITGLRMIESGAVRTFDSLGNLVSVDLAENQTTLNFTSGELKNIESSGEVIDGITFDSSGGIDSARIIKAEGEEYFFTAGALSRFIDENNIEYQVDSEGRILSCRRLDTGEVLLITEDIDPADGIMRKIFTSESTGTQYVYKNEVLTTIIDSSGLVIAYLYDEEARTREINISFGGVRNSTYLYEYTAEGTVITDDLGTRRFFDENNRAIKIETPYGETYDYAYDVDIDGKAITIVNYTQKENEEGTVIQYFEGQIKRIDKPDGTSIDNIEFDRETLELKKFSVHTPEGKHHNVIIEGKYTQFEMEDSTRLIFCENTLVALAGSQGIVSLYDEELEDLEKIIYNRDRTESASLGEEVDIAASSWRHQTYQDSQAINFVERDYLNNQWEIDLNLITGDEEKSQGEMYLDLRYDIPGLEWQAPIDMRGKEISFMFKLDEAFEYDPLSLCNIQAFAKDENWNSQYGTRVEMVKGESWIRVSLVPTEGNVNLGFTDPGFDPSRITMIGLRISEPDFAPPGKNFLGKVYLKHDILPDLFANVNWEGSPLDDLYSSLGLVRDLDRLQGDTELTSSEAVLESFVAALGEGPSDIFQRSTLQQVSWKVESEDPHIQGVNSIYRDTDSNEFVLDVDLSSLGENNSEGEVYFDLRSDVPGVNWNKPVNLVERPVRILINIPEGLVGSLSSPNGARIFVEDENMNMQYGTWINLKEGGKWYQLELTPTFGDILMGNTYEGFDPSKITRIGVNIATQESSGTSFQGEVRLKFLDGEVASGTTDAVNMPLWMDLRNVREYLVDENDNYLQVPQVNYLSEYHYSYVFNQGSGMDFTVDLSSAEEANTVWKREFDGISSVSWNSTGDALKVDLGASLYGDMYLDLNWSCYVPGRNWSGPVDMTRHQIKYYVRTAENFTSVTETPVRVAAFVKDSPNWRTEFGEQVEVPSDGQWHEVKLTPCPVDFNQGYVYYQDFDPTKIAAIGLRVNNPTSGGFVAVSGSLEVRYEINEIENGLHDLSYYDAMPDDPVWVDQRDLANYLKSNNIGLYSDFGLMEEIKSLAEEVPGYMLPSDFAATIVYDEDKEVKSIAKPDGTTTHFSDEGRIDYISFSSGSVFIDYEYNPEGELVQAVMSSAREKLTSAIDDAVFELERNAADTLLLLAEQKKLLTENFMEDVNAQRRQFASQRASLEAQRYIEIKHRFLWWTWTERVERPGINEAIAQVNREEAEFNRQVAEELAKLDSEIAARRDEIIQEKELILAEYAWQGEKMMLAVLHEEAIPIIFYYYRNVLGRDATQEEIEAIFDRIDGNNSFAGFLETDLADRAEFLLSLKAEVLSPVYSVLSGESKVFIENFLEGEEAPDEVLEVLVSDLDKVILTYNLYQELVNYYGSVEEFDALLSEESKAYRDSLAFLGKAPQDLTDLEKNDIEWLNRYILQDLFPGLRIKDKNAPVFNALNLRDELILSDEHLSSEGFKRNVIDYIKNFLQNYLDTPSERGSYLDRLGLSEGEVIGINEGFLGVLYQWLEGQDLHFGKSAFGSLKKMMDERGVSVPLEEVAKKALLMDILLGITGPMTDTKIEVSMFSMSRIASMYGVSARNVRLNYDDILGMTEPFVTLINVHHYVTVLSVTDTEVTYWEQNVGTGGSEVTISRREFEDVWQGNVITDEEVAPSKELSDSEAKKIKGAFFGLLIGAIIGAIFSAITTVVTIAITAITVVLTSLVSLVAQVGALLVEGVLAIGNMLSFAGKAFMGALGASSASSTAGSGFTFSTLIEGAGTTLIKLGAGYGTSVGLEMMGVDPVVSGFLSSIVTGGVDGFLSPEGGLKLAFSKAIEYGSFTGMNLVGQYMGMDPLLTDIMSMASFGFVGDVLNSDISFMDALGNLSKNLLSDLALYGVQVAGNITGLNPEITYLAGMGIRSSLQAGLGTFGAGGNPLDAMWNGLVDELTKPTNLAIAFNLAGDALGLDPIINNMMITAVMGAIDGFYENPEGRILGMFQGMFDNFWNASIRALTFGLYDPIDGGWNKNIQKDYALMNLTRFIEVVMDYGIEAAIENHLSNIFRDEAIRVINQRGGIADFLTGDAEMVEEEGVWLKKINVTDEDKLYLDPKTDDIVGRDYGTIRERGEYGTNPHTGGFGLIDGTMEETTEEGTRMVYYVSGSTVIDKMEVYGISGGHIQVIAKDPETGLQLNENGIPLGGVVADFEKGKLYTYEHLGDSIDFEMNFDNPDVNVQDVVDIDWSNLSNEEKEEVINYYLVMNGIANPNPYGSPRYMFNFETDIANADPLPKEDIALIPLYNGEIPKVKYSMFVEIADSLGCTTVDIFENLVSNGYIDRTGDALYGTLSQAFFDLKDPQEMILDSRFEAKRQEIFRTLENLTVGMFGELGDWLSDGLEWLLKTEEIAARILQNMTDHYNGVFPEDITGVCYSGSGDPFVYLLNQHPEMDVKSLVLVGTPIRGSRTISNTNVETVVTIYGSEDEVFQRNNEQFRNFYDGQHIRTTFDGTHLFDNNPTNLTEIAIELDGIGHDYFYDPGNPRPGDDIRQKSSRFIAKITAIANDRAALIEFLETNSSWIKPDQINNKYIVDLQGAAI